LHVQTLPSVSSRRRSIFPSQSPIQWKILRKLLTIRVKIPKWNNVTLQH